MTMRIEEMSSYRGSAHWQEVVDAYDPDVGGGGSSRGEYVCGVTEGEEAIWALEHWRGLFGGIPGGHKMDSPEEWVRAASNGQVQEITQVPYVRVPGRRRAMRIPGVEDLHQLTPSASFEAARGPIFFPEPIVVPAGTELLVRWLASQQDRGAHIYSVYYTVTA